MVKIQAVDNIKPISSVQHVIFCISTYLFDVSLTEQDIFSELNSNDSQYSGDANEGQTPIPVRILLLK